ncbi:MAG: NmrA-like protein, partial [Candidatus Krumholzibacteriota bacterium]|nr:NmrA-like protein [Candidatus Krumholzibacteriota bacterium]
VLLVRNADKVKDFAERGAIVQVGNLEDADFVARATKGVDVLFWLTPANMGTDDFRGQQNQLGNVAIRAIRQNSIPRVVNLSSVGAQHENGTGPIAGLHDIEQKLDRSGAHVTHLRPTFFMENLFMLAETMAKEGAAYFPVRGSAKMEMIATRDIAKAAAERVLDASWTGRSVIELLGPAEQTFEGAAKMLGKALGKDIHYVTTTFEQTREALVGMGVRPKTADLFCEMYKAFDAGMVVPEAPAKARRTATTLESFAAQVFRPGVEAMAKRGG